MSEQHWNPNTVKPPDAKPYEVRCIGYYNEIEDRWHLYLDESMIYLGWFGGQNKDVRWRPVPEDEPEPSPTVEDYYKEGIEEPF